MRLDVHKGFFSREGVAKDQDRNYLFGDNLIGQGMGGQAIIRGLSNAYGIPTKKYPSMTEDSFFTDDEYEENVASIIEAFQKVPRDKPIVVSENGLGTGLAKLQEKAPRTARFLDDFLSKLAKNPHYMELPK